MTSAHDKQAAAVRALASDVDRLTREVQTLGAEQARTAKDAQTANRAAVDLARAVKRLAAAPAPEPAADEEPPPPLPYWLAISDPEQACTELVALVAWIRSVYLRFPDAHLPACWTWHEHTVAELHVLRLAWLEARDGKRGSASKLLDWHDRGRPGVVRRIKETLGTCSLAEHTAGKPETWRPPRVPGTELAEPLAAWWASTHGTTAPPAPTPEMLAEERDATRTRTAY